MNEYVLDYRDRIEGKTKEEAIKILESCLFYLQLDDYMNWNRYYACKQVLNEVKGNE